MFNSIGWVGASGNELLSHTYSTQCPNLNALIVRFVSKRGAGYLNNLHQHFLRYETDSLYRIAARLLNHVAFYLPNTTLRAASLAFLKSKWIPKAFALARDSSIRAFNCSRRCWRVVVIILTSIDVIHSLGDFCYLYVQ